MPSAAFLGSIFNIPVSGASDPYFANVVALLHFDGNYTDQKGHIWTPSGSPTLNTTTPMYGSASLKCANSTQYVKSATSTDHVFGTGPFTIEFAFRATGTPANLYLFDSGTGFGSAIQFGTSATLAFYTAALGTGTTLYNNGPTASVVCDGNKHRISISRQSGVTYAHFDGTLWGSATDANNYPSNSFVINGYGGDTTHGGAFEFDDVRITKGIGRYGAANYSLSSFPMPFPDS